jgi:hypothetical protein
MSTNISVTVRASPCRELLDGSQTDDCRPADDIVNPVAVGSEERASEIGEQVLYRDGYRWIKRQIQTDLSHAFQWGETMVLDTPSGQRVGKIGPVQHDFTNGGQSFSSEYIPE